MKTANALSALIAATLIFAPATLAQTSTTTKTSVTTPGTKTTSTTVKTPVLKTVVKAPSSLENNRKIARQWYEELIVKENLPMVDVLIADDAVMEMSPSMPSKATGTSRVSGKENIRKHLKNITDNFSYKGNLLDVIAEGDKVVLYRIVEETDKAGHKALVPWISIIQISNNKIKKITHVHDTMHEANQFKAAK